MNWQSGINPTCGMVYVARTTSHSFTIHRSFGRWLLTSIDFPIAENLTREVFDTIEGATAAAERRNGGSPDR